MKTTLLLVSAVLCTAFASAQTLESKNVPAPVVATFNAKFPKAKKIEWEKEKENYEVSFTFNKTEQTAVFDPLGNLIETEVEIKKNELPENVNNYVLAHYPSEKIKEVSKITTAQGAIVFEVEIQKKDLLFDTTGTFLKEINQ
jgi:hypothetical protein